MNPHLPSGCPSGGHWITPTMPPSLPQSASHSSLFTGPDALGRAPCPAPLPKHPESRAAQPTPQHRSSALPCPAAAFLPGPLRIFFSGSDRSCVFLTHAPHTLRAGVGPPGVRDPSPCLPSLGHCLRGTTLLVTRDSPGPGPLTSLPASPSATLSLVCSMQGWTQPPSSSFSVS